MPRARHQSHPGPPDSPGFATVAVIVPQNASRGKARLPGAAKPPPLLLHAARPPLLLPLPAWPADRRLPRLPRLHPWPAPAPAGTRSTQGPPCRRGLLKLKNSLLPRLSQHRWPPFPGPCRAAGNGHVPNATARSYHRRSARLVLGRWPFAGVGQTSSPSSRRRRGTPRQPWFGTLGTRQRVPRQQRSRGRNARERKRALCPACQPRTCPGTHGGGLAGPQRSLLCRTAVVKIPRGPLTNVGIITNFLPARLRRYLPHRPGEQERTKEKLRPRSARSSLIVGPSLGSCGRRLVGRASALSPARPSPTLCAGGRARWGQRAGVLSAMASSASWRPVSSGR